MKYRILHILYWVWATIDLLHEQMYYKAGSFGKNIDDVLSTIFGQMLSVYSVIWILIPFYFNRQKYVRFFFLTLLFIVASVYISIQLENLYLIIFRNNRLIHLSLLFITRTVSASILTIVFIAVVTLASRVRSEMRTKQLEKEKLQTELDFLRSQVNPHFLFNTLNNIYVLIDENKKIARDVLLKFSNLLRYLLYECAYERVDIAREMNFLNDYIELEKIRCGDSVNVEMNIPDKIPHFPIAPFILIPLVENAFKHVSGGTDKLKKFILMEMTVVDNVFYFSVVNSNDGPAFRPNTDGGIGLQNVTRRLELIYPAFHNLDIINANGTFTIKLVIHAEKNELHHS